MGTIDDLAGGSGEQPGASATATLVTESTYVVQRRREGAALEECWDDVATVTVPPRTRRQTVLRQALDDLGLVPERDMDPIEFRVLDADSAEVIPAGCEPVPPPPEPPAPTWRIG